MEITPLEPWIKTKLGTSANGAELRTNIDRHQLLKLRETVDYVRTHAPFYRTLFDGIRGSDLNSFEDIASLPFTTPEDIQENDLRFLCVSRDEISRVVTLNTSGTTALAKRIHFTEDDLELTTDLFHHGMQALVRPGGKVLILMPADRHGTVGDLMVKALKRMDVLGIPYGIVMDSGKAIAEIVDKEVDCLIGIPVQVLGLVRHRDSTAIPKGMIKSVLLSADYVPAAIVKEIENAWECPVFNHYGMTEMGLGAAVDCKALRGYHIREADLFFEIVDPDSGRPVPEGATGEVVFSTLTRKGMPLVRYRTGDLSRFLREPCPCGTILKRLEWVKGRLCGGVRVGGGNLLTVADLDEALFPLPGLLNFQVEISGDGTKDILRITLYSEDSSSGNLCRHARIALEGISSVRAAVDTGLLTIAPIQTSEENWISTGSIKRKIIDSREG
ncbi:MAG: phenylacetate--CoA ligase family protein [Geobacter sp.]|nr:MAG: phenylacetate--CoA ligase family protein [Geobacter sp.]